MIINCIAIDDEPLALDKISDFIGRIDYLRLMKKFDNAFDAVGFLKKTEIDLMFLDIQMDDFTGIELLETLQNPPYVILTTAYDHYALKGYELDVSDYLLKPVSFSRFLKAVEKVYSKLNTGLPKYNVGNMEADTEKKYFFCKDGYKTIRLDFNNILYVEGMKDYLKIVTADQKIHTLLSFKELEEKLPDDNFVRVHRSYIVTIDKIDKIEHNHIYIRDKEISIGSYYKKDFFDRIEL